MRVVVPYTALNPLTKTILESYRVPVEYCPLEGDDGYRQLLKRIWDERRTTVLIEQDILPWPGAIEELHNCCGLWCSCSYLYHGCYSLHHMFGCTKLSTELMTRVPTVWDRPEHWSKLDAKLYHAALAVGEVPHPHRPPVIHLNGRELAAAS